MEKIELISIIIPFFNAKKYLKDCIRTVQEQDYKNLEIIFVDDGSTDDGAYIVQAEANKDERIHLYRKENGGVASARNYGLNQMTGDYFSFLDVDDFLDSKFVSNMYFAIKESCTDIAVCLCYICKNKEYPVDKKTSVPIELKNFDSNYDFCGVDAHYECWGKLYRSSIGNIRFREDIYVGEDLVFWIQAAKRCHKYAFVNENLYYYIQNQDSATHGTFNEKKMTELDAWEAAISMLSDEKGLRWSSAHARYCLAAVSIIRFIVKDSITMENKEKMWNRAVEIARKNSSKLLFSSTQCYIKIIAFLTAWMPYCMGRFYAKLR